MVLCPSILRYKCCRHYTCGPRTPYLVSLPRGEAPVNETRAAGSYISTSTPPLPFFYSPLPDSSLVLLYNSLSPHPTAGIVACEKTLSCTSCHKTTSNRSLVTNLQPRPGHLREHLRLEPKGRYFDQSSHGLVNGLASTRIDPNLFSSISLANPPLDVLAAALNFDPKLNTTTSSQPRS